jgi:hypothetical protein
LLDLLVVVVRFDVEYGVPSSMSTPVNRMRLPSTDLMVMTDTPMAFGRRGERVEKTPINFPSPCLATVS